MWIAAHRTIRKRPVTSAAGLAGLVLIVCFALAGCAAGIRLDPRDKANFLARERGFVSQRFDVGDFVLQGRLKTGRGEVLAVHIEGDGLAWRDRRTPSTDPTPRDPVSLFFALADPNIPTLHLARPCQYVEGPDRKGCDVRFWTTARYAPVVVEAISRAVDEAKRISGAKNVELWGFSGGGALAVLVAAERADVVRIVTTAANLDLELWTAHHKVSPLVESVNPMTVAAKVAAIPQVHFLGEDDEVVPRTVTESFLKALGNPPSARLILLPGVGHVRGWEDRRPEIFAAARKGAPIAPGGALR